MDLIVYALCKKYVKKSLAGLGALKGSPCKIKNVQPVYSTQDPTVVLKNIITLEWDSNQNPAGAPIWHEEIVETLDNGRGIYKIEYDPVHSTAAFNRYVITFYDGTTDSFDIPASSGSMKKKVVTTLPTAGLADKNTIYLVPIAGKVGEYQQWIAVENDATGAWEWLSLGTTSVNLEEYQLKIDPNLIKSYPNYDPNTKGTIPNAKNVVGGINEHEKVLGSTYDYTNNEISNLETYHKDSVISVLNELGDITTAENYDADNCNTFVDLIDVANADFTIEQGAVDRTKNIDVLDPKKDNKDGTPKISAGKTITIPRVDIDAKAVADTGDYRTYEVRMGGELTDPEDATNKAFGKIDIPTTKIVKVDPPEMTTTDSTTVETWGTMAPSGWAKVIQLSHIPINSGLVNGELVPPVAGANNVSVQMTAGSTEAIVRISNNIPQPPACDVKYTFLCENTQIAAEYYLDIAGLGYNEQRCGAKIEIAKSLVLKDASVKVCEAEGVPLPQLHVGEKYLDMTFETGDIPTHAYIAVKDMFTPYKSEKAIVLENDPVDGADVIKLKIYDPTTHEALIQTDDGLQILEASETQKGIVQRATQDEERTATESTKYVSPFQLHDFAVNSESVEGDLANLATDADDKFYNKTIVNAINEVASAKVRKATTPDEGDILTYDVSTTPATDVVRMLGEKIHIEQVNFQVEQLSTIASPKKYQIYYLNTLEIDGDNEYRPGLWMHDGTVWQSVASSSGIIFVDELPEEHINEECFYVLSDDRTIAGRYALTATAKALGYSESKDGIDLAFPAQHWTWLQIQNDWANWFGDEIEENVNGHICLLSNNEVQYDYLEQDNHLYYRYANRWIEIPVCRPIETSWIDTLEMID